MAHNIIQDALPLSAKPFEPVISAALAACVIAFISTRAIQHLKKADNALIPEDRLTARTLFELIASFVVSLGDSVMGRHNRKYIPFVGTIFVYILFMNFLGLIPGFSMPTDGFAFNFGIAAVVFILYTAWGIKEVGIVSYLKHLCGPVWWLAWLIFPIEALSHFIRPLSLGIRLFGNMTGDHLVLQAFTDIGFTRYVVPVVFYGLGTLVCFIQAFVFMLLTMIYIRMAVAHDDHDGEHAESASH